MIAMAAKSVIRPMPNIIHKASASKTAGIGSAERTIRNPVPILEVKCLKSIKARIVAAIWPRQSMIRVMRSLKWNNAFVAATAVYQNAAQLTKSQAIAKSSPASRSISITSTAPKSSTATTIRKPARRTTADQAVRRPVSRASAQSSRPSRAALAAAASWSYSTATNSSRRFSMIA